MLVLCVRLGFFDGIEAVSARVSTRRRRRAPPDSPSKGCAAARPALPSAAPAPPRTPERALQVMCISFASRRAMHSISCNPTTTHAP
jgi:hypothetical protein